jgi:DNA polymerase III subunit gamma/tau
MRDAQTLLDQLIAVSDGTVNEEDLNLLLGAARGEDLDLLISQLLAGESAKAIESLDRIISGGVSAATLLEQLVGHVRAMMLIQTCGSASPAVQRLGLVTAAIESQAATISVEKSMRIAQILMASQQALRHGVDPRLQVELACVRIARLGEILDIEGLLRRIERLERSGSSVTPNPR